MNFTQQELKKMAEERKRCAAAYPDWENNDYNCLDNKFIYGINLEAPNQNCSFATVNDLMIYYNRKSKLYFFDIDPDFKINYDKALILISYFKKLLLTKYNISEEELEKEVTITNCDDLFSANDLLELYRKFVSFVQENYKW